MDKNSRKSGATYLPERYKQLIEAKKRRRFFKKVLIICGIVLVTAIVYGLLSGALVNQLNQNKHPLSEVTDPLPDALPMASPAAYQPSSSLNLTVATTPTFIIGTGMHAETVSDILSLDDAMVSLYQEYPESGYTMLSVNQTDRYTNSSIYEFRIRKNNSSREDPGFPVFIDAITGDPYTPGQESAGISASLAKDLVREIFSIPGTERIRVRYENRPDSGRSWDFAVYRDNSSIISGSMDPDTGQIVSFSRPFMQEGRPAEPSLDISAAQKIADHYIIERNGAPLPVNMSDSRYMPLELTDKNIAGNYVFIYNRIVQNIPCDYDGFTISVDSATGDITGYNRRWDSPDNAFSVAADPLVKRYQAIFSVQQKAQEMVPLSDSGFTVVSSEIRWKDMHPPGVIPRPGSITTAWKIQFDDDNTRSKEKPVPATGWVDARTGKILDFYYD